jgi:hypothetical protein
LAAIGLGQVLAERVFQMEMAWMLELLPTAMLAGALMSMGVGWSALRSLLRVSPLTVLRSAG